METKIKHLESQLIFNINKVSSPSHYVKQTNFKLITSGIPVDEKTGECRLLQTRQTHTGEPIDVISPNRLVYPSLVPSDMSRSRISMDYLSKGSYNRENVDTNSDEDAITPIDEEEIVETGDMYAADTTPPRWTNHKTAFSKTCALM